jgi:chromosome segregation ATPase
MTFEELLKMPAGMTIENYEKHLKNQKRKTNKIKRLSDKIYELKDKLEVFEDTGEDNESILKVKAELKKTIIERDKLMMN